MSYQQPFQYANLPAHPAHGPRSRSASSATAGRNRSPSLQQPYQQPSISPPYSPSSQAAVPTAVLYHHHGHGRHHSLSLTPPPLSLSAGPGSSAGGAVAPHTGVPQGLPLGVSPPQITGGNPSSLSGGSGLSLDGSASPAVGVNVNVSPQQGGYISGGEEQSKLSGFFKNISFGGKTTKDGQPAKRRGPKPDAKPAQTRRQELNRQAQRTHRERKELYVRQLEVEISRLREAFATVSKEKAAYQQENIDLKNFLALHGLTWPPDNATDPTSALAPAPIPPPPPLALENLMSTGMHQHMVTSPPMGTQLLSPGSGMQGLQYSAPGLQSGLLTGAPGSSETFDAIGVDFVLALEEFCFDHIERLVTASFNDPEEEAISGHALMALCPPPSHITQHAHDHGEPGHIEWGKKTYALPSVDLGRLLNFEPPVRGAATEGGEVTPITAWSMVQAHPRFLEFTRQDFAAIKAKLVPLVNCYGFGAVLEQYMVEDAIDAVWAENHDEES